MPANLALLVPEPTRPIYAEDGTAGYHGVTVMRELAKGIQDWQLGV